MSTITCADPGVASGFLGGTGNVMLRVKSNRGLPAADLSKRPDESEVIIILAMQR